MAAIEVDSIIIGAGFSGCYLLKVLREQGLKVKLLEAGTRLGGVWCWNQYPGARVDCEFPYYGYSDSAVWGTYVWPERFPDHVELRRYFEHAADVWDLRKDISFGTTVTEAAWLKDHWLVKVAGGERYQCRWLMAATGSSYKVHVPDWKGRDLYEGDMHHAAHWPDGLTLDGKRVAVIGSGSTGIQLMQEAGKVASKVTHYVRSPNLAVPLCQRQITPEEVVHHRSEYPHVFKACRATFTTLPMLSTGRKTFDDTPEARQAVYEEQWRRGGFNWSFGCYTDHSVSKEANRDKYSFWASKTRARIQDAQKRDILAPVEAPYYLGTKRPSLESDYYEQCDKAHVEVTNSPIEELTRTGIRSKDGERDFDIIAVCTGYDAVTGGLKAIKITGRNGQELQDRWKDGVRTYLGMTVHGFPNMFMLYGPQAPTSFTNAPIFIEMQCEWIADVIAQQRRDRVAIVEAKESEESAWRNKTLEIASKTLAIHTDSWYMGANIPGKRREILLWLGGVPAWHKAAVEALQDWKGFDCTEKTGEHKSQAFLGKI